MRGGVALFDHAATICYTFFTELPLMNTAANDLFTYFFPALSHN
jgi:hypothetical protein